jgi:hypothetical protein
LSSSLSKTNNFHWLIYRNQSSQPILLQQRPNCCFITTFYILYEKNNIKKLKIFEIHVFLNKIKDQIIIFINWKVHKVKNFVYACINHSLVSSKFHQNTIKFHMQHSIAKKKSTTIFFVTKFNSLKQTRTHKLNLCMFTFFFYWMHKLLT